MKIRSIAQLFVAALLLNGCATAPTFAPFTGAPEVVSLKTRFGIDKNGNFSGIVLDKLTDPNIWAGLVAAGCSVFSDDPADCTTVGLAVGNEIRTFTDRRSNNEFYGKYFAPPGYQICKAKIDWDHTGIDSQSTFSTIIQQDGLGYYASIPSLAGRGTGINSDIYLQFVKTGLSSKYMCWPVGTHPWNCRGPGCTAGPGYGFYPGARYP